MIETDVDSKKTLKEKYGSKDNLMDAIGEQNDYKLSLKQQKDLGLMTFEGKDLKDVNEDMLRALRETCGLTDSVIKSVIMKKSAKLIKNAIPMDTLIEALKANNDLIIKLGAEKSKEDLAKSGLHDIPKSIEMPDF